MLALAIIALIAEFVLNICIGFGAVFGGSSANWIIAALAACCFIGSIFALVGGIKGIRNPLTRGKSIATTIIAGLGVTYGFGVAFVAGAVAAGLFAFESISGDFTFTMLRALIKF